MFGKSEWLKILAETFGEWVDQPKFVIVTTSLDGFSLANHWKFAKLATTFSPYGNCFPSPSTSLLKSIKIDSLNMHLQFLLEKFNVSNVFEGYFTFYKHICIGTLIDIINNHLPPASVFAAHEEGKQAIY